MLFRSARAVHATLLTKAAQDDTQIMEQIDLVENLLAQKVSALVIAPSDSDLLKPVLDKAAKRIPVVLFDSDIPGWKPKTAYVGTPNEVGGEKAGRYIAKIWMRPRLSIPFIFHIAADTLLTSTRSGTSEPT